VPKSNEWRNDLLPLMYPQTGGGAHPHKAAALESAAE
jgi:hypothetical protein